MQALPDDVVLVANVRLLGSSDYALVPPSENQLRGFRVVHQLERKDLIRDPLLLLELLHEILFSCYGSEAKKT